MELRHSPLRAIPFLLSLVILFSATGSAAIFRKSQKEEKRIALTFDDGPSQETTDTILDILSRYGIKATFFVIGKNAQTNPEKIKMIADAGHEIGNHTYTHCYINRVSEEKLKNEIEKTETILTEITGSRPVVFRPPGGAYNDSSIELLERMGYKSVLWSLDTRDWSLPKKEKVVSIIEKKTQAGDIILFHDLDQRKNPTPDSLEIIIPYLLEQGYSFVTVSELLENEAA